MPRVPLPDLGVTSIGEAWTASCEDITPRSQLLQTHSSIPLGSPLLRPKPRSWSLCRLLPVPCCRRDLPDVISVNPSLGARAPVPAVPRSALACFFLRVIGLPPYTIKVGFPHCSRRNDFMTDPFFETAAIPLCSGPQVCSPPRSFLPLRLIAAGQPRLLRPSRTCFVASACIGFANHPYPGN